MVEYLILSPNYCSLIHTPRVAHASITIPTISLLQSLKNPPGLRSNTLFSPFSEDPVNMEYHGACGNGYDSDPDSDFNVSHSDSNLNRKFDIAAYGSDFELDTTLYEQPCGLTLVPCPAMDTCPHCGLRPRHTDSIIIAVDGACRGNGTVAAGGAIGIYFADASPHNVSEKVLDVDTTSQKNELRACLRALKIVMRFKLDGVEGLDSLTQVMIKADSEYLVKSMTEWVFKWRENAYRTAKGHRVTNMELFRAIDHEIDELFRIGVEVLFWLVPRAQNKEADALCNDALGPKSKMKNRVGR